MSYLFVLGPNEPFACWSHFTTSSSTTIIHFVLPLTHCLWILVISVRFEYLHNKAKPGLFIVVTSTVKWLHCANRPLNRSSCPGQLHPMQQSLHMHVLYVKHPLPCIPSLNFIIILIVFSYTFFAVTFAAVAIFSYAFLVPTALWGVLLWRKSNAGYSFLEILCVYGYSLFIYIPISVSFTTFYSNCLPCLLPLRDLILKVQNW